MYNNNVGQNKIGKEVIRTMRHQIIKEELQDYEIRHDVASSVGGGKPRQSLTAVIKNDVLTYEVTVGGQVVTVGRLEDAIDLYNVMQEGE